MEAITITNDEQLGWKVQQGERYADALSYDEMLGLVASLTMPEKRPCLQWMRTQAEHITWNNTISKVATSQLLKQPFGFPVTTKNKDNEKDNV